MVRAGLAPALIRRQNHFGVGFGTKRVIVKLTPQFQEIVDLSVEHDVEISTRIRHGLMTGLREVDNTQPVVSQTRHTRLVYENSTIIGTPVMLHACHGFELASIPARSEQSGYATHNRTLPSPDR